jgi:hypothetical protein
MSKFSVHPIALLMAQSKADLEAADEWFATQIAAGFESSAGIKLGLSEADVTLLTGNYVLSKEAAALELPLSPVIDTEGVAHTLSIEDLTSLMLEYGQYRAQLSQEYAAKKAAAAYEPPLEPDPNAPTNEE